jgi:SAM-dependent methyltransferase
MAVSQGSTTTARVDLHLPPRGRLRPTGDDDPLRFYYMPIVGRLYRRRLEMAARMLGENHSTRCAVEIGYGSGILLPELGRRARRLVGIDRHGEAAAVLAMARAEGLDPLLVTGGITALPLAASSADLLVGLSVLEHVRALDEAAAEIARVLRPGGRAVLGYPRVDRLMEMLFPLIGFHGIEQHHVSTPADIERALAGPLRLESCRRWPRGPLPLYTVSSWRRPS